jgi:peptidyl-prolyl cis-trans isomerase B (cyclophilin B)
MVKTTDNPGNPLTRNNNPNLSAHAEHAMNDEPFEAGPVLCYKQNNYMDKEFFMAEQNPKVIMETSKGAITVELFADKAPISARNFLSYVKEGYYDGLIFHRVIKGFMVQGGGLDENLQPKKTKFAIKNEAANGLKNLRGTLAMARTAVVDSATSQFFINVVDNSFLDYKGKRPEDFGYAVFGQVVEGMDVVDAIREVKTGNRGGHADVPVEAVFITSARVCE